MGEGGEQLKFTVRVLCFWLGLGLGLADIRFVICLWLKSFRLRLLHSLGNCIWYLHYSSLFDIFIFSLNTV